MAALTSSAAALQPVKAVASDDLLSFCKATADALRLDILRALRDESFGVGELCHIFEMPQPGMSHHLKVLAGAGLVETRREGNSIFYRRSMIAVDSPLTELTDSFFAAIDRIPLEPQVAKRIGQVHDERSSNSRQFFEKHADQLRENQSMIAEFSHYSGCVRDLITNEQIPGTSTVLEIGPGESELLNLLADGFHRVVALDNSREMLAKARQNLQPQFADVVEFIHGEPEVLVEQDRQVDLIVLNMVLHHLSSPARLFRTANRLLNPEGRLIIIDLRPHNQDWAREICGDLWLGFEPQDLEEWAREAGLTRGQSVYIGLKNGFQVQVKIFHRPRSTH